MTAGWGERDGDWRLWLSPERGGSPSGSRERVRQVAGLELGALLCPQRSRPRRAPLSRLPRSGRSTCPAPIAAQSAGCPGGGPPARPQHPRSAPYPPPRPGPASSAPALRAPRRQLLLPPPPQFLSLLPLRRRRRRRRRWNFSHSPSAAPTSDCRLRAKHLAQGLRGPAPGAAPATSRPVLLRASQAVQRTSVPGWSKSLRHTPPSASRNKALASSAEPDELGRTPGGRVR